MKDVFNRALDSRVFGPPVAALLASAVATHHALDAPQRERVQTACRYGWRTFVSLAVGASWYSWSRPGGGCGPARWFWRKPKHPRWVWAQYYVIGK